MKLIKNEYIYILKNVIYLNSSAPEFTLNIKMA